METRRFGRSGWELPVICPGTWQTFEVGPDREAGANEVVEIVWDGGTRARRRASRTRARIDAAGG